MIFPVLKPFFADCGNSDSKKGRKKTQQQQQQPQRWDQRVEANGLGDEARSQYERRFFYGHSTLQPKLCMLFLKVAHVNTFPKAAHMKQLD